jgi:predicted YcjX-like family ATPase
VRRRRLLSGIAFEAAASLRAAVDAASSLREPVLRLGVTGLCRSGKTVFITALVDALTTGARMPMFRAGSEGRLLRARIVEQPHPSVPRFAYEEHLEALTGGARRWPASTDRISELRLELVYESTLSWMPGPRRLTLDIVDYPGEWLLDLSLLRRSYGEWAAETLAAAAQGRRSVLFGDYLAFADGIDPSSPFSETTARSAADMFRAALIAARSEPYGFSALPPGRFLMPGDLAGSPALTFAPLRPRPDPWPEGSFGEVMERRYDAYIAEVVRPFFRDHFARLDRQIVLVDLLSALNAGPEALRDLEAALGDVLAALRPGRNSIMSRIFRPRIEKVLFAATKADLLHHQDHDRLEALLRAAIDRFSAHAQGEGAVIAYAALASVRATREAMVRSEGRDWPAVLGVPEKGETIDGRLFDGEEEVAVDPGELPEDPSEAFDGDGIVGRLKFVRFRPPIRAEGHGSSHIRLDRVLEFLMGDRLA